VRIALVELVVYTVYGGACSTAI